MFAINHAAAALALKRRFPRVPILALLVSVQALEILWVLFNVLGFERTTTNAEVRSVRDIHLAYIPYSHSLATAVVLAAAAGVLVLAITRRRDAAAAIALGIASHFVLDLITHAPDLPLAPGVASPMLGSGLYSAAPIAAFALETCFAVLCWRLYRGSAALLCVIVFFNLANVSLFSAAIPGPERWLADRPMGIVALVFGQIVITLAAVLALSRRRSLPASPAVGVPRKRSDIAGQAAVHLARLGRWPGHEARQRTSRR